VTAPLRHTLRNALVRATGAVAALRGAGPGKRALALHEVPDPARFADFVDRLQAEYELLTLDDWLRGPVGERTQLTLTFDDGYASWHEDLASILAERNLPAVFFVNSGLVGLSGERARDFTRDRLRRSQELRFIGRDQLRELAAHPGFEVGAHTATHADLGPMSDRGAVAAEVDEDKATLEDWVQTDVRWFAYPFGMPQNVSRLARTVVEEAGFAAAFTLIPGWWEVDGGDRYRIGRDGVDPALPFSLWRAWLRGGYDRLYSLKSRAGSTA
jgi:peptidoglycan/xylan/chitin deacetylase (PgdA/CDA1 family)